MAKYNLPIGIHSFRQIREDGLKYVDKTGYAAQLVEEGKWYFLSRPRRFGKSLFVNMLKELFMGNEKLFRGLAIHENWDWSTCYPVIRLSFGAGDYAKKGYLKTRVIELLDEIEARSGASSMVYALAKRFAHVIRKFNVYPDTSPDATTPAGRLTQMIRRLKEKTGRPVVLLVDEYDKPILDAINSPAVERENREILRELFSTLKEEDDNIHFCFVTGVSMFAQVSLFSGSNQLRDITLSPKYSTILGYTESDIDEVFSKEVENLDREKIRDWYNGYRWRGEEKVYNPLGILLMLVEQDFQPWWYATSTPQFLIDVMKRRGLLPIDLEDLKVTSDDLLASNIESISAEALLFQTGYMTIAEETMAGSTRYYKLNYPNREVRQALNASLLESMLQYNPSELASKKGSLFEILKSGNVKQLEGVLKSLFAGIPHQWHLSSGAANYETYFTSVVYAYFVGSGIDVRVEDSTSEGRIDLAVIQSANIYLFEFKLVNGKSHGDAIKQIERKSYAAKYHHHGKPIHLVGVEFSKETKNVAVFNSKTV